MIITRIAVLALSLSVASAVAAQDGRTRIDTTYRFARTGSVELTIVSGEIRITTWDRDEIRVLATTERGEIVPSFSADRLRLDVRNVDRRLGPTRYEVTVPAGVRVRARSVSGNISATGTKGELDLASVSGAIEAGDGVRRTEVETVSGRVTLRGLDGVIDVSTVSGSVDVERVQGELEATTVSGRVRVDGATLRSMRLKSVSGAFDLNGSFAADGRSTIESHSGSVTLRVPSAFAATMEMETWSGELTSDFAVTLQPGATPSRRRMEMAVNGGGARLSIKTFSGDIFLRKSDASTRREN
jgi:DUF4097 and DUF4098 domain-containing protein YvlB